MKILNMFRSLWNLFSSQDKFTKLFILVALLFVIVTPIIVSQIFQTRQYAGNEQVSIYFTKHGSKTPLTNASFTRGETVQLDLYMDTKTANVNGFDITTALTDNNVFVLAQPGVTEGNDTPKFNVSLINNWASNRWRYTKVNAKPDTIVMGQLHLATIPFTAFSEGAGTFDFTVNTTVTSPESNVPVSIAKYALSYTVVNPTPTPTEAPSPTVTPTPDPYAPSFTWRVDAPDEVHVDEAIKIYIDTVNPRSPQSPIQITFRFDDRLLDEPYRGFGGASIAQDIIQAPSEFTFDTGDPKYHFESIVPKYKYMWIQAGSQNGGSFRSYRFSKAIRILPRLPMPPGEQVKFNAELLSVTGRDVSKSASGRIVVDDRKRKEGLKNDENDNKSFSALLQVNNPGTLPQRYSLDLQWRVSKDETYPQPLGGLHHLDISLNPGETKELIVENPYSYQGWHFAGSYRAYLLVKAPNRNNVTVISDQEPQGDSWDIVVSPHIRIDRLGITGTYATVTYKKPDGTPTDIAISPRNNANNEPQVFTGKKFDGQIYVEGQNNYVVSQWDGVFHINLVWKKQNSAETIVPNNDISVNLNPNNQSQTLSFSGVPNKEGIYDTSIKITTSNSIFAEDEIVIDDKDNKPLDLDGVNKFRRIEVIQEPHYFQETINLESEKLILSRAEFIGVSRNKQYNWNLHSNTNYDFKFYVYNPTLTRNTYSFSNVEWFNMGTGVPYGLGISDVTIGPGETTEVRGSFPSRNLANPMFTHSNSLSLCESTNISSSIRYKIENSNQWDGVRLVGDLQGFDAAAFGDYLLQGWRIGICPRNSM